MQSELELKYILDRREFPGDPYEKLVITDFAKILEDDEVKIVVETMGGLHPAYEYVTACLKAGKSVVTSNKELVAVKGCELLKLADEKNVNFLFEASVGGGIPIIRPISQCLAANDINEIAGILNGTTNFILTKMISDGMTFDDALFWRRGTVTPSETPPPTSTASTPAARYASWRLYASASTSTPSRSTPRVSAR